MLMYSKLGLVIITVLFLASCSSTGSQVAYTPGSSSTNVSDNERQQILEEQRILSQERERQAEENIAQKLAEAEEAERQTQLAAERIVEEERQAQEEERQAQEAEQARVVAAQQARIEELRNRIASNESETENLEAANAVLRQAVMAAEQLTEALETEEEKFNSTDPVTGEPLEELATAQLNALAEEVKNLNDQAESLITQP